MTNYDRAVEFLTARLEGADQRVARVDLSASQLDRQLAEFSAFLRSMNWLEPGMPIIHIAGSKGKGSTAAFATSILTAAGFRVGTFTSPHLHAWNERIAIDSKPLSDEDFAALVSKVAVAESAFAGGPNGRTLNLFEFLTAMAIAHFMTSDCHALIVEVGLGGRFDPTNVLTPTVSVITRLELEHVAILGPTLKEIAWNKAGIIKADVPVVTCQQETVALAELETAASHQNADLSLENRDWSSLGRFDDFTFTDQFSTIEHLTLGLPGQHQVQNAGLAIAAIHQIPSIDAKLLEPAIRRGLASTTLAGRFEPIGFGGREIIIDIAHTPESAAALAETLLAVGIDQADFVVGLLADKDAQGFFSSLQPRIGTLQVAPLTNPRSAKNEDLLRATQDVGLEATAADSIADALRILLSDARFGSSDRRHGFSQCSNRMQNGSDLPHWRSEIANVRVFLSTID